MSERPDAPAAIPSRWPSRKRRKTKATQMTRSLAVLADLRDVVDQYLDGDASLQDLGAALDRTWGIVECVEAHLESA